MSHTPGPWKTVTTDEDITTKTIIDEDNYWIARVLNFDTDIDDIVESKANARLIAAAPELLEALKNIIIWDDGNLPGDLIDAAKQVIKKAEKG